MASLCPYHDKRWRGETQHLINILRGTLFQVSHVKRFRRVICTCEGTQSQIPTQSKENLEQWLSTVNDGIIPQSAKKVLRNMLATSDSALLRVVTLTKLASVGNLQCFELPSKGKGTPAPEPIILQEKLKLDFPAAYLGLLMGRSGTHIKALCKEHSVTVHFTGDGEGEDPMKKEHRVMGPAVWAVVKHQPCTSAEQFKEQLKQKAEKVAARRKLHETSVLIHMRVRAEQRRVARQKFAQGGIVNRISAGVYSTPKEAAIGHFEKKSTHKYAKRQMPSIQCLTDGHCLQCGTSFDRKSNSGCKYHSGYLAFSDTSGKYKWSCCSTLTDEAHPDTEMHQTTGCCSGLHVWRPPKGVRRKNNKPSMAYVPSDPNDA